MALTTCTQTTKDTTMLASGTVSGNIEATVKNGLTLRRLYDTRAFNYTSA